MIAADGVPLGANIGEFLLLALFLSPVGVTMGGCNLILVRGASAFQVWLRVLNSQLSLVLLQVF